jgi:hypothetical protein
MGNCCYILWPFGILYGHLVNLMTVWYILCSLGRYIFTILVSRAKKNLATMHALGLSPCIGQRSPQTFRVELPDGIFSDQKL